MRPMEWSVRSPDVTPLDFFFWGYLKNKVYARHLYSLTELKIAIRSEIHTIKRDQDVLKRVCLSVTARVLECLKADGEHIEFNV